MAELSKVEEQSGVCIYDRNVAGSLYNLLPASWHNAIDLIPPEAFNWTEEKIRVKAKPPRQVRIMRLSFWQEYYRSLEIHNNGKATMPFALSRAIPSNISSTKFYYNSFLQNPLWVLFVLTPVQKYEQAIDEILEESTRKLLEILQADVCQYDDDGNVIPGSINTKLADKIIKIHAQMEARKLGSVIQRSQVEQKNLNVHVGGSDSKSLTFEQLTQEIKSLEQRLGNAPVALPPEKEVLQIAQDAKEILDAEELSNEGATNEQV